MTILVFRDENEIPFCYSHVSRRDRDFRKSFLVVEREKMKLTLVENSRDREFSLTSGSRQCAQAESRENENLTGILSMYLNQDSSRTFNHRFLFISDFVTMVVSFVRSSLYRTGK